MYLDSTFFFLPFAVALVLIVAAEVRDRRGRAKSGQRRTLEPVKLPLIPSLAVGGGAAIGAIAGGLVNHDIRVMLIVLNVAWSLLILISLVRLLKGAPRPAVCAALSVFSTVVSFFLVDGLF